MDNDRGKTLVVHKIRFAVSYEEAFDYSSRHDCTDDGKECLWSGAADLRVPFTEPLQAVRS